MTNPFTPSFGVTPPELVGRDEELAAFSDALDEGPGSPDRAMMVTGVRGSGKTVLLNAFEDIARQSRWVVISETTRPGLVEELVKTRLPALLAEHDPDAVTSELTGASATGAGFGGSVSRQRTVHHRMVPSLRSQLDLLTDLLQPQQRGVLITLDEVHAAARDELRNITQTVQHAFREGRQVAFAAAGLPSAIDRILSDPVTTFLRRAERYTLDAVNPSEVRRALRQPIETAGRTIADDALDIAAQGTQGYPFLVQLVGYQTWNARRAQSAISAADARTGVDAAIRRVGRLVHEPSLSDLSDIDRSYLAAMSVDEGPSRTGEIAERLGVAVNYASQYRLRLLSAGLIQPVKHGYVDFTIPYLRTYLREHVTSQPFNRGTSGRSPGAAE